jgi:hypothetical protein
MILFAAYKISFLCPFILKYVKQNLLEKMYENYIFLSFSSSLSRRKLWMA